MDTTRERVKDTIGAMADKVHQATDTTADRARQGTDKAANVVDAIGAKAHDLAAAVAEGASHAKESVQHMASTAAESVVHAKDAAVNWTADAAQHPGEYLKACNDEMTGLIRRYPIPALLVGIGIGFMLARATRAGARCQLLRTAWARS